MNNDGHKRRNETGFITVEKTEKSSRNRLQRRSMTRHPITMASTAKPLSPPNGRLLPVVPGTDPPHPGCCPGSHRRRTPHDRPPSAGTAQKRTPSHVSEVCPGNQVFCIWGPSRGRARVRERCAGGRVGGLSSLCLPGVQGSVRVDAWAGASSGGSFRAVAPVSISGI